MKYIEDQFRVLVDAQVHGVYINSICWNARPDPGFSKVRLRIEKMNVALANGTGFTDVLATIEGLNQQAIAMAASGETAGKLDEMLHHYSTLETELTHHQERQLATWLPRVIYLVIALWIGWQMVADSLPKLG